MILTGMILSKLAALTKDIQGEYLNLTTSYVLREEKTTMKTAFRKRQIFITGPSETAGYSEFKQLAPYLVANSRGTRLNSTDFAKVWKRAVDQAGMLRDFLLGETFLCSLEPDNRHQPFTAGRSHGACIKTDGI